MQKISSVLRAHCIKNKHVVVRGVQGWVLGCVLAHSGQLPGGLASQATAGGGGLSGFWALGLGLLWHSWLLVEPCRCSPLWFLHYGC